MRMKDVTRVTTIQLTLTSIQSVKFDGNLPTNIGTIYGMSTHVIGRGPANEVLITLADSFALYIVFRTGTDNVIDHLRLCDLLYMPSLTATEASAAVTDRKYLPVHINGHELDLTTSSIENPTGISSGEIVIWLWYTEHNNKR